MKSSKEPLFSFGIVSYKNYKYIYEAVDSVLKQTYPNIELLISNDASDDFDEQELTSYIDAHKKKNIVRVDIHNNETNLGTVRNIENIRQKATGEYIMYMAADDALYDEYVLSRYAEEFEKEGENALVVSSLTAMCGNELDDIIDYLPDEEGVKVIQDLTPLEMFSYESHTFLVPTTSTCYRMKLYDIVGPYDTEYYIIEDASLYVRMARMGIGVCWIDDMIGARHRDGGISHGNTVKLSLPYQNYRFDEIVLYKKDILPFQDKILDRDREKMEFKWEYIQYAYYDTFIRPNLPKPTTRIGKVNYFADNMWGFWKNLLKEFIQNLVKPKLFRKIYLVMGGVWMLAIVLRMIESPPLQTVSKIILSMTLAVLVLFIICMVVMGLCLCLAKALQKVVRKLEPREERTVYVARPGTDKEYVIDPKPPAISMKAWISAIIKMSCKIGVLFVINIVAMYLLYEL